MRLFRTRFKTVFRRSLFSPAAVALVLLAGCASDPTGGGTNAEVGSVAIAVYPGAIQVAPGVTTISAVTLTRINGFLGTVALTADSLPKGVSVTFDPAALGGVATTALMTVTAVSTAVPGTTTVRVTAAGTLARDSTNVTLTVAAGALALTVPVTSVNLPQDASVSIPISLARSNGFVGGINLAVEGLPANVIATFTPALIPKGANASTLELRALAGTTIGTTPVIIRARGQGLPDKTAALQLAVVAANASGFTLVPDSSAFTLVAGKTAQSVVRINRTGGFAGAIGLQALSQPGITALVTPSDATGATATVTVGTASAATAPGTYSFSLVGTASGATSVTVPFTVVVREAPAIRVQLIPNTVRIAPGSFAQTAVLLTRVGGFTGDFVMTAEGLPAGVTAVFGASVVPGTATSLTFVATANATPGVYNVTVKATAGSDAGSATLTLTVGVGSGA